MPGQTADPMLAAYVAVAVSHVFPGLCRDECHPDAALVTALQNVLQPALASCHDRRPRDWVAMGDGRRVRYLHACWGACWTIAQTEPARTRLLRKPVLTSLAHQARFAFTVSALARLREAGAGAPLGEEQMKAVKWYAPRNSELAHQPPRNTEASMLIRGSAGAGRWSSARRARLSASSGSGRLGS